MEMLSTWATKRSNYNPWRRTKRQPLSRHRLKLKKSKRSKKGRKIKRWSTHLNRLNQMQLRNQLLRKNFRSLNADMGQTRNALTAPALKKESLSMRASITGSPNSVKSVKKVTHQMQSAKIAPLFRTSATRWIIIAKITSPIRRVCATSVFHRRSSLIGRYSVT